MPDETGRAARARSGRRTARRTVRRTVRIVLLCVVVAAILFLAVIGWLSD
jgi:hypothetical protein